MSRWEFQRDPAYYRREPELIRLAATAYDRFDAGRRFDVELDRDPVHLAATLAAMATAAIAGAGFGHFHLSMESAIPMLLYAVAAAGLTCAVTFREAVLTTADCPEGTNFVAQAALVGLCVGYLLVPTWLAGRFELRTALALLLGAAVLGACLGFNRYTRWGSYAVIALVFPLTLGIRLAGPGVSAIPERIFALVWGGLVLLVPLLAARRAGYRLQPAGLIVQLAAVFATLTVLERQIDRTPPEGNATWWTVGLMGLASLAAAGGAAGLFLWLRRRTFAAAACAVALVQLLGVCLAPDIVYRGGRMQIAAAAVEFLFLVIVAVRVSRAEIRGMPPGNFLRSPACDLPLLEQAQGYALESDVCE